MLFGILVGEGPRRPTLRRWWAQPTLRACTGSQLLEQRAGFVARVFWRAFEIGEALFENRGFLRISLANLGDDLFKRRGLTAHLDAVVSVVVQDHLGLLEAAL